MKKIKVSSEAAYLAGAVIMGLSVALTCAANFGVSMIVGPAYLISTKLGFLTLGQCEYIVQAILFVGMCLAIRRFRPMYLVSFGSCLLYGALVDLWRLIPVLNPNVTAPGSMGLPLRIVFLGVGLFLTAVAVALYFRSYIFPQVYEFFVTCLSRHFKVDTTKFKTCFDLSFLALSLILTFVFYGKIVGLGIGTVLAAFLNGPVIGLITRFFDKHVEFVPTLPKLAALFGERKKEE